MLPGVCQHMFGRRRRDSIFLPAPIGSCTIKRSWVGIYCSLVAPKHMDMVIWSLLAYLPGISSIVFPGSSQTSHEACSPGPSMWQRCLSTWEQPPELQGMRSSSLFLIQAQCKRMGVQGTEPAPHWSSETLLISFYVVAFLLITFVFVLNLLYFLLKYS